MGGPSVDGPAPPVAAGGRERTTLEQEGDRPVCRLHPYRPRTAANSDVATGVHEARAALGQKLDRAVGGIALGDPSEVEADPGGERDPRADHVDFASARRAAVQDRAPVRQAFEGPVVPGGDDGVVHGRVEEPTRGLARLDRRGHDLDERGRAHDPAVAVESRELGVGAKPGHRLLESLELHLDLVPAIAGAALDEELDLGSHRVEDVRVHHDVRVTVTGGSVTTRTAGGLA